MTNSFKASTSEEQAERLTTLLKAAIEGCLAFATYSSGAQKRQLLAMLKAALAPELAVRIVEIDEDSANLPDLLLELSEAAQARSAFFVYDLEKALPDVIGYMNQGRELLASVSQPVVVWVRPETLNDIAQGAPDTWAWRSGVFDFTDSDSAKKLAASIAPVTTRKANPREYYRELIEITTAILDDLPWRKQSKELLELSATKRLQLASLYESIGEFVAAAEQLRQARDDYKRAERSMGIGEWGSTYYQVLAKLGGLELLLGRFNQSMVLLREALAHYERVGDVVHAAEVRHELASLFEAMNRTEDASVNYTLSSEKFRESGQLARAAGSLARLSNMLFLSGKTRRALGMAKKALSYADRSDDQDSKAALLNNIGVLYAAQGQLERAIHCFNESLEIRRSRSDIAGTRTVLANLVRSHKAVGTEYLAERLIAEIQRIEDSSSMGLAAEAVEAVRLLGEYRMGDSEAYNIIRSLVTTALPKRPPLSQEDREDVIQKTMVKLWTMAGELRPQSSASLASWVSGVARREFLNHARRRSLDRGVSDELLPLDEVELAYDYSLAIAPDALATPMREIDEMIDVEMALSRLSERERTVIEMLMRGMSEKEIAHELGKSVTTVGRDRRRAFKHLRRQLVDVSEGIDSG